MRSSWLMLATNCDLCWLAISSSRLFSSISSNRRALSMAIADWSAKVCIRSTISGRERAGLAAPHDQRADDLVLVQQRHGEQRAHARLDAASRSAGAAAPSARSANCTASRRSAHSPTTALAEPDRLRAHRARCAPRSCCGRPRDGTRRSPCRTRRWRRRSASDMAQACSRMVCSTTVRSSDELTVWPTSPSARSSSTERASSACAPAPPRTAARSRWR